jgi:hypothetical protein
MPLAASGRVASVAGQSRLSDMALLGKRNPGINNQNQSQQIT